MTRWFACTVSMEPSARTEPSCSTVTRESSARTNSMSCSTTTTEWSLAMSFSMAAVCSVSESVMPATGSSPSNNSGDCIRSMPISSHCFCPCDNAPAGRSACAVSAVVTSASAMRSFCSELSLKLSARIARLSHFNASSRFSNTEWFSNTVGFWNLRPMPRLAMRASSSLVRSILPLKKTSPASGRVLPVMTSIMVVLPAPFGPMIARNSPERT